MMDQNLGRFEVFEVPPPSYDPFPDPDSHLRRQVRITGETVLLRSPGIELSGYDREAGRRWYQKNIGNATMPGAYASCLECSLHDIDEARRAVAHTYQQCQKFGSAGVPRIIGLLCSSSAKSAIVEFYSFLSNLQYHLQLLEQCVPGSNSGTSLKSIVSEDPLSRTHFFLIGKMLIVMAEVILCSKCPEILPENLHVLIEFGDDLLRIAFLIVRFTYDVHPALGSAILKYGDRLGTMKSEASQISYDKCTLKPGPYMPYFLLGERTDADVVRCCALRLRQYMAKDLRFTAEHMMDLIDTGAIVAANVSLLQKLLTLKNICGLWFCKQYRSKVLLTTYNGDGGPDKIEELAQTVYRYENNDALFDRSIRLDEVTKIFREFREEIKFMIHSLSKLSYFTGEGLTHPLVPVSRKRTVEFLTCVFKKLNEVVANPTQFAGYDDDPFDQLYYEQDAYLNKLVYQRLCIGHDKEVLPLLKHKLYLDASRLTTKFPDYDRLYALERWPKETIFHIEL